MLKDDYSFPSDDYEDFEQDASEPNMTVSKPNKRLEIKKESSFLQSNDEKEVPYPEETQK